MFGDGINKLIHKNNHGYITLDFRVLFFLLVFFGYLFFSTYLVWDNSKCIILLNNMNFSELAKYLERLENTSSRLEITRILAELFHKSDAIEIDKICYLILGGLAPGYKGIVFNIAEKLMVEIIAKAYHKMKRDVIREYKEKGDLGIVAESLSLSLCLSTRKRGRELSVTEIHSNLLEIAQDEGEKSVERKIGKMAELLSQY